MSVFGKIFGSKKPEAPTTQESLQKLQETEDLLSKKQDYLEGKIREEVATARKYGTQNKRMALQALRRKKNYEKQLQHLDGVLNTIAQQKGSLENATMNSDVLQVISSASKALKKAHNEMDVDKVHDLMEDIAEQQEVANEIANAISSPVGLQGDVDEEELLKELEQMEEADLSAKILEVGGVPVDNLGEKLPTAPRDKISEPSKKVPAQKKQEDDDLAELEAWAAT